MKTWKPLQKPAVIAEERLLQAITSGHFAVNSNLPAERELAEQIGVTRPTMREAMQRLARDGWLDIQHGKPTRVRDYWMEGNMGVLSVLARMPAADQQDFVSHLLEVRALLAPAYTRQALQRAPEDIETMLAQHADLEDSPAAFARTDWELHVLLTRRAENPIFRLLFNSFEELYQVMGEHYFASQENRERSRAYYANLLTLTRKRSLARAEALTRQVMEESLACWNRSQPQMNPGN